MSQIKSEKQLYLILLISIIYILNWLHFAVVYIF